MNHEKTDKTIKENRIKVMDSGRKKEKEDSLLALIVSCHLAQLSPCPQRCPRETQSSLQSRKNNMVFFSVTKTFSEQELYLTVRGKKTRCLARALCSDLVGWECPAV